MAFKPKYAPVADEIFGITPASFSQVREGLVNFQLKLSDLKILARQKELSKDPKKLADFNYQLDRAYYWAEALLNGKSLESGFSSGWEEIKAKNGKLWIPASDAVIIDMLKESMSNLKGVKVVGNIAQKFGASDYYDLTFHLPPASSVDYALMQKMDFDPLSYSGGQKFFQQEGIQSEKNSLTEEVEGLFKPNLKKFDISKLDAEQKTFFNAISISYGNYKSEYDHFAKALAGAEQDEISDTALGRLWKANGYDFKTSAFSPFSPQGLMVVLGACKTKGERSMLLKNMLTGSAMLESKFQSQRAQGYVDEMENYNRALDEYQKPFKVVHGEVILETRTPPPAPAFLSVPAEEFAKNMRPFLVSGMANACAFTALGLEGGQYESARQALLEIGTKAQQLADQMGKPSFKPILEFMNACLALYKKFDRTLTKAKADLAWQQVEISWKIPLTGITLPMADGWFKELTRFVHRSKGEIKNTLAFLDIVVGTKILGTSYFAASSTWGLCESIRDGDARGMISNSAMLFLSGVGALKWLSEGGQVLKLGRSGKWLSVEEIFGPAGVKAASASARWIGEDGALYNLIRYGTPPASGVITYDLASGGIQTIANASQTYWGTEDAVQIGNLALMWGSGMAMGHGKSAKKENVTNTPETNLGGENKAKKRNSAQPEEPVIKFNPAAEKKPDITPAEHQENGNALLNAGKTQEAAGEYLQAAEIYAKRGQHLEAGEMFAFASECETIPTQKNSLADRAGDEYMLAKIPEMAASLYRYASDNAVTFQQTTYYSQKACKAYALAGEERAAKNDWTGAIWAYQEALKYAKKANQPALVSDYTRKNMQAAAALDMNGPAPVVAEKNVQSIAEVIDWCRKKVDANELDDVRKAAVDFISTNVVIAMKIAQYLLDRGFADWGAELALEIGRNGGLQFTKGFCASLVAKNYPSYALRIAEQLYIEGHSGPILSTGDALMQIGAVSSVMEIIRGVVSTESNWVLKAGLWMVTTKNGPVTVIDSENAAFVANNSNISQARIIADLLKDNGYTDKEQALRVEISKATEDPIRARYFGYVLDENAVNQHLGKLNDIWNAHPNIATVGEYEAFINDIIAYAKEAGSSPEVLEASVRFCGGISKYHEEYAKYFTRFADNCLKICDLSGFTDVTIVNLWRDGFFFQVAQEFMVPEGGPQAKGLTFTSAMLEGQNFHGLTYNHLKNLSNEAKYMIDAAGPISISAKTIAFFDNYKKIMEQEILRDPLFMVGIMDVYEFIKQSGCVKLAADGKTIAPQFVLFTDTGFLNFPPFLKAVLEYGAVHIDHLAPGQVQAGIYFMNSDATFLPQDYLSSRNHVGMVEGYVNAFQFSSEIREINNYNQPLLNSKGHGQVQNEALKTPVAFIFGMCASIQDAKSKKSK